MGSRNQVMQRQGEREGLGRGEKEAGGVAVGVGSGGASKGGGGGSWDMLREGHVLLSVIMTNFCSWDGSLCCVETHFC